MKARSWLVPFLDSARAELVAADNTIRAYASDLGDFADHLTRRKLDFTSAMRGDIEAYLIALDHAGLAPATRARRLSAIRQLYRFAYEEGWRSDNPAAPIKGPKKPRRLPKTLSVADVDRLLNAAAEIGASQADRTRNACLFQLLYATGMRVSELVTLPVAAVRGDPRMLLVRGKGGKERMVPLTPPARAAVASWLVARDAADEQSRRKGRATSAFLFPGNGKGGHLTRIRFYTLVKEAALAAGIAPDGVTPHTLRHAFASHLLANGADLRVIQTLLGHADISTTEIYTHVLDERLKDLVHSHHPLARDDPG
ncbi:MAG: site-specific tyrosine recombinase XerD [Rhodobacteraceae bacterium]|nr:site-specific tyrosine recombinase XerD [Paracoccaceae bacterium]